jgi:hypothetical protein
MKKVFFIYLVVMTAAGLIGCGKESKSTGAPVAAVPGCIGCPPGTGTGSGGTGGTGSTPLASPTPLPDGDTKTLNPVSLSVFSQYRGSPVNRPSPIQFNIKMSPRATTPQVFLGYVHIRYNDVDASGRVVLRDGYFSNGQHTDRGNNIHILTAESGTGIPTYRFFFEDRYGALIVTLQQNPAADAAGTLNAKVYFRNFNTAAPNPLFDPYFDGFGSYWPSNQYAYCWSGIIQTGPYDCRNNGVQPTAGTGKEFTFLGTVDGIDKNKALGI